MSSAVRQDVARTYILNTTFLDIVPKHAPRAHALYLIRARALPARCYGSELELLLATAP